MMEHKAMFILGKIKSGLVKGFTLQYIRQLVIFFFNEELYWITVLQLCARLLARSLARPFSQAPGRQLFQGASLLLKTHLWKKLQFPKEPLQISTYMYVENNTYALQLHG